LSWLDKTPESALKGIRKMVGDVVKDMGDNGEEIPEPIACKRYSGKFMVRVPPRSSSKPGHSGVGIRRQPEPYCRSEAKPIEGKSIAL